MESPISIAILKVPFLDGGLFVKKNRAKIVLIVGAVALALYFLYPTYKDYRYTQQLKNKSGDDSLKFIDSNEKDIRNARLNRMKLGLDLQGGMRVVLEVNVVKFLKDMARSKDDIFNGIMAEIEKETQTTDESIISVFAKKFEVKRNPIEPVLWQKYSR